jgi:hypothetical protein
MPLQKVRLQPGVNRENTRYTNEGRWYECDKIRFRQGSPEKIGGWRRISGDTFQGVCRSLSNWVTLGAENLFGVGTNLKFYIVQGGAYNDITPLRATETLTDPFATTAGSPLVDVTDAAGGYIDGDFVTFSGATAVGGLTLNGEYQISYTSGTVYTIDAGTAASSTASGGGTVTAEYQINVGPAFTIPLAGWGAGGWGYGTWGVGQSTADALRLWSQTQFGEDLIFGPRDGAIYYWDASSGVANRAVLLSSLGGASNVPTVQNFVLVSDISRFVFAFGCNELGGSTQDPMLVRWSDQEDATNWTPDATNQAGDLRLSRGSEIVTAIQSRQELLVWTDSSLYSLQYVGAGAGVWGAQLVGDNISIAAQNAVAYANGVAYWMGRDKFYMYDGRTQALPCDLRRFVFDDLNPLQFAQVTAGTNEAYHEIWWFYCSANSTQNNRYVVYNYLENVWYYGTMSRTAWLDSGLRQFPLAATYNNVLVNHEDGVDDNDGPVPQPIHAYVASSPFDLDDGDKFSFIWRMLPDVTFDGSTAAAPQLTMTLLPMVNAGSGYTSPPSVAGSNSATVARTAVIPIEAFTGQVYTRVRGRQLALKVESTALGVRWQLGSPRLDIRPDGRR